MYLSESLAAMSARAKEAEVAFTAAALTSHRAKLEEQVEKARASAQERNEALRTRADQAQSGASAWWRDVQQQWDRQTQQMRSKIEEKREDLDAQRAATRADIAEADAALR